MFFYLRRILFRFRKIINKKQIPLQVRQHNIKKQDKRTSLSASQEGSMTVEAAVVLPVLLCALMGILLLAKVMIINQEMEAALLETGRQITRKECLLSQKGKEGAGIALAGILFQNNQKQGDGGLGVSVSGLNFIGSEYKEESKEIYLKMNYKVRVPLLLLGTWKLPFSTGIVQKAWNGYAPASGEFNASNQEYVYITEDGEVYHKDGQCYHLHITVHETEDVDDYYDGKTAYRPCEYCIHRQNKKAAVLYIPEEGDCYHSDPACGGLTRTVRYVKKEDAAGMRPCSHCCN